MNVDVVIEPPSTELSIWIVKVAYDPNVVQVTGCTPLNIPVMPNVAGGADCATQDTNADLIDDTAVALGGLVRNVNGVPHGFETTQIVATFTFKAIGPPGSQSPLHVTIIAMLGPNGEVETPATNDGVIHVIQGPSPTPAPVGGAVELLSTTEGSTLASGGPPLAVATAALVTAGCIAFVASRRIIGR